MKRHLFDDSGETGLSPRKEELPIAGSPEIDLRRGERQAAVTAILEKVTFPPDTIKHAIEDIFANAPQPISGGNLIYGCEEAIRLLGINPPKHLVMIAWKIAIGVFDMTGKPDPVLLQRIMEDMLNSPVREFLEREDVSALLDTSDGMSRFTDIILRFYDAGGTPHFPLELSEATRTFLASHET